MAEKLLLLEAAGMRRTTPKFQKKMSFWSKFAKLLRGSLPPLPGYRSMFGVPYTFGNERADWSDSFFFS
jgi:hypothetical protein